MVNEAKLEVLLEDAKTTVKTLEAAIARKRAGIPPCPSPESHITRGRQVVGGYVPFTDKIIAHYGYTTDIRDGYQVKSCLVCGKFVLYTYLNDFVGPVTQEEAEELIDPTRTPKDSRHG